MKFTKFHNPNKKRRSPYSKAYIEDRKNEMYAFLTKANTDEERDNIIKAFSVSTKPYIKS